MRADLSDPSNDLGIYNSVLGHLADAAITDAERAAISEFAEASAQHAT